MRERYDLTRAEAAFLLEIVKGGGRRATAASASPTEQRPAISRRFSTRPE
jgi:hypothetical protein